MDSFFIRPESPGEVRAIFDVHCQAFAQDGEARLVNALREDGKINPNLSLVAVHDNTIIGHILFCPISIDSEDATVPATALAPLGVHQDYQCRGIGAALVQEGLDECRRLGQQIVIVVGHPGYYPRFGFTKACEWGIHAPFPCPDEAFMALGLEEGALDGVSGTVHYPLAFDRVGAHTS